MFAWVIFPGISVLEQSCEDQMGGFFNRSKCYTIPHLTSSGSLTYSEAVAECKRHGYLLAEIHDMTHQKTLEAYVRRKMPDTQSVTLWLGMEYKSMVRITTADGGTQAQDRLHTWDISPYELVFLARFHQLEWIWKQTMSCRSCHWPDLHPIVYYGGSRWKQS